MSSYKTIIVDDEKQAREGVKRLLSADPSIEICALCHDGLSAIEQINRHRPDIVLLDVQMPGINGFEVLNSIQHSIPAVIFITAHDQFAIKAFEVNAIDYLLKPFTDERFADSLEKAKKISHHRQGHLSSLLKFINQHIDSSKNTWIPSLPPHDEKLIIKQSGKVIFLRIRDVIRITANDYYIKIYSNQPIYMMRESLKSMESRLKPFGFLRIHRSHLVNSHLIRQINNLGQSEYQILFDDGSKVVSSRRYKKVLIELIARGY